MARILLIEDDAATAAALTDRLRERGHEVVAVPDGPRALERADDALEAALCDWYIPGGMSGVDVARELLRRHPELPVVMMTSAPLRELQDESADLPLRATLSKSAGLRRLVAAVEDALGDRGNGREPA